MIHTLILILHVLGAAVVFGVVVFSVLAVMRPSAFSQQLDRLQFVSHLGMYASAWQLVTGVILYFLAADELKGNPVFWAKLGLYVIEGVFASTVLGHQFKKLHANPQTAMVPRSLVNVLVVHAILITAIIVLGVVIVEQ